MVDTARRKKLAFHLRQFAVGLTFNDDFEDSVMQDVSYRWSPDQYHRSKQAKSDDPVIQPMIEMCWGLYSDLDNRALTGRHKLSEESLKTIARCILFLRSEQEYKWPHFHMTNPLFHFSWKEILLTLLSLGGYYFIKKSQLYKQYLEMKKLGNFDLWPFMNEEDYNMQLLQQPFLAGIATS